MRIILLLLGLFLTSSVFAQQQTPAERALGTKLLVEINAGLQCSGMLIGAQDEIAKLQARVRELEAKVLKEEPK